MKVTSCFLLNSVAPNLTQKMNKNLKNHYKILDLQFLHPSTFFYFRSELYHDGSGGWRRAWHPPSRHVHGCVQKSTPQNPLQPHQPAVLISRANTNTEKKWTAQAVKKLITWQNHLLKQPSGLGPVFSVFASRYPLFRSTVSYLSASLFVYCCVLLRFHPLRPWHTIITTKNSIFVNYNIWVVYFLISK